MRGGGRIRGGLYTSKGASRHLRRVGFVHSSRLVTAVRVRRRTVRLAGTADDVEANANSSCSSLYARGGITGKYVSCQPQRLAMLVRVRRQATIRLTGTADDVEANMNSPFRSQSGLAGTAKRFVFVPAARSPIAVRVGRHYVRLAGTAERARRTL